MSFFIRKLEPGDVKCYMVPSCFVAIQMKEVIGRLMTKSHHYSKLLTIKNTENSDFIIENNTNELYNIMIKINQGI